MAITSSAKKAIRVSARKRVFNLHRKDALSDIKKKIARFMKEHKINDARALLPKLYKATDKATKSYLKKNTAARIKSRITIFVNKVSTK